MGSQYPVSPEQIEAAEEELKQARAKVLELRRAVPLVRVQEYQLSDPDGNAVKFSELFQGKDELMVIYNMGKGCSYCTMWADGFNGVWQHMDNRAPFVVVSPDPAETVKKFSTSRGWAFRIYSSHGTSFFKDLGFASDSNAPWPGVSVFRREPDGTILRTAYDYFGPGDPYCSVWHLMDLLPKGVNGWEPKYNYDHE